MNPKMYRERGFCPARTSVSMQRRKLALRLGGQYPTKRLVMTGAHVAGFAVQHRRIGATSRAMDVLPPGTLPRRCQSCGCLIQVNRATIERVAARAVFAGGAHGKGLA